MPCTIVGHVQSILGKLFFVLVTNVPQEILAPSILLDQPADISMMLPMNGAPNIGLNLFSLAESSFPTPAISGVNFCVHLLFIQLL